MQKRIELYSLISGLVFLISSIAKAVDISVFSNIVNQYGVGYVQFLTPLIVITEAIIGLALVFQFYQERTSFIAILLLFLFTIIYAYGIIFKGISDCGCFGKISFLNTSPVVTFIRNAVLFYLLVAILRKGENKMTVNKWIAAIMITVICLVAFMSGYTYRYVANSANKFTVKAVKESALKDFINVSKDSTYLVFAFTYTCPHCLNSIANLKQYETSKAVDKVIGIALSNPVAEQRFKDVFNPQFSIKNYPEKTFLRLTTSFPKAFYIKNDSIIAVLSGELPCSFVFMAELGIK